MSETDRLAFYGDLLGDIKGRIRTAQIQAASAVNSELVRLYWDIGRLIVARQKAEGWGAGIIPRLSQDLRNELPEVKGFSQRNIMLMVQFSREYPTLFPIAQTPVAQLPGGPATAESEIVPQPAGLLPEPIAQTLFAQLPWGHNLLLIQMLKDIPTRLRDISKPIGVAEYELTRSLPAELASSLPSIEQIEAEMHRELTEAEEGADHAPGTGAL